MPPGREYTWEYTTGGEKHCPPSLSSETMWSRSDAYLVPKRDSMHLVHTVVRAHPKHSKVLFLVYVNPAQCDVHTQNSSNDVSCHLISGRERHFGGCQLPNPKSQSSGTGTTDRGAVHFHLSRMVFPFCPPARRVLTSSVVLQPAIPSHPSRHVVHLHTTATHHRVAYLGNTLQSIHPRSCWNYYVFQY